MLATRLTTEFSDGSLGRRYVLAVANALMAAVVGTLTLGIGVGIVGALVMLVLPFTPVLRPMIIEWAQENKIGAGLGLFLLSWILGTVIWGLAFAVAVALVLAPSMIVAIVVFTLMKPAPIGDH